MVILPPYAQFYTITHLVELTLCHNHHHYNCCLNTLRSSPSPSLPQAYSMKCPLCKSGADSTASPTRKYRPHLDQLHRINMEYVSEYISSQCEFVSCRVIIDIWIWMENVVIAGGFDNSKGCWVWMVKAVSHVCWTQLLFSSACEVDFGRMVGKEEQE